MFESALLETHHTIQSRRKGATLVSLILEAVIIGTLVVIPLLVTQALPTPSLTTRLLVAPPPPPPPPAPAAAKVKTTTTATKSPVVKMNKVDLNALRTPTKIPKSIDMRAEAAAPAPEAPGVAGVAGGVPGGVQGGTAGGVLGGILNSGTNNLPAKPKMVKVSQGVSEGLLVHKVTPQYPPVAKQAHVQGSVVLKAIIGKDGKVENVQAESGNALLASAAVNAVKQWRYKPYVLNGSPVDVETIVTVNFNLSG